VELNEKLLIKETETLKFFAEKVDQDEDLKQYLFEVLESKYEERVQIAATNSITILNYARVSFAQKDFSHIRIPGADLSYSNFDHTDLRESDLRNTTLNSSWLNNAKLGGALMKDVKFSEWPFLETTDKVSCITFSKDGHYLVAVLIR